MHDRFVFIANKGLVDPINDRGGLQYLFKAFKQEFREDEPVELIAKINCAYWPAEIQRDQGLRTQHLSNIMNQIGIEKKGREIKIIFTDIPSEMLSDFYNEGDVFISTTRCDGFNIPGIEAMACGLPNIQTNFGGQLDYMDQDNSWYIECAIEEVKHDLQYEGVGWATPLISEIRTQMRYVFENQEEVKKKSEQALLTSKRFTWEETGKKADQFLKELK